MYQQVKPTYDFSKPAGNIPPLTDEVRLKLERLFNSSSPPVRPPNGFRVEAAIGEPVRPF